MKIRDILKEPLKINTDLTDEKIEKSLDCLEVSFEGEKEALYIPKDNEFEFKICTNIYIIKDANEFVNSMMPEIEKLALLEYQRF